jgi:hypothetical protein
MPKLFQIIFGISLLWAASLAHAADYYVAPPPQGKSTNPGSLDQPWDLQTALNHPSAVNPGDTIWLRGGIYAGPFVSRLSGTASQPIILRAYLFERVIVNDSFTTILETDLPASRAVCTFRDGAVLPEGGSVLIGTDQVYVFNRDRNNPNTLECIPGWNGTTAAAHPKNSIAYGMGSIIQQQGSYVWFWGFEITSVRPERLTNPAYKGGGLNLTAAGKGNKAINMIIHSVGHPAIGFWNQGDGGEVYGSVLWGNGLYDNVTNGEQSGWTRGNGIYAQNEMGSVAIKDTIAFKNFTTGMKAFGEGGYANGFTFEGNITFDNTSNISAATSNQPIERLKILSNYLYNDPSKLTTGLSLGYVATGNVDAEIRDNYIVSSKWGLLIKEFQQITAQRNTVVAGSRDEMVLIQRTGGFPSFDYSWNNNAYFSGSGDSWLVYNGAPSLLNFAAWKTNTGYDSQSSYTRTYPTANDVFVRPNAYERGRGHIVVYNWENKNSVQVDIKSLGLTVGDTFEVRDVQNYLGVPILKGSYTISLITLPLNLTTVNPIVGAENIHHFDPTLHTKKEFNSFVVLKTDGSSSVPAPSPSPPPSSEEGSIHTDRSEPLRNIFNPMKNECLNLASLFPGAEGAIEIVNRRGEVVRSFSSIDSSSEWDGRNQKGEIVSAGVYLLKYSRKTHKVIVVK